ncbi:hypothetical protein IW261DRAFT_1597525 [Armillaria novae-zelandiae]|uniref:Uncharacterized protein n=1 Tax=Armillaria novae-zelandiae TaxID=153914 RepID=A0AA39TV99_9AGAR|nr:hypothetical protein IW261DRAFT_1597525 [Armillaria novae-zelandiae]
MPSVPLARRASSTLSSSLDSGMSAQVVVGVVFETKASDSRRLLSPEPTFYSKKVDSSPWAPSGIHYAKVAEEGAYHIDFDRLPTPTFCDQFGDRLLSSSLMEEMPTPFLQSSFGSRHTSPQTSPPATPSPVPSPKSLPHLLIPGKDDPAIPASRYLLTRPIAQMKTPVDSPTPISPSSSVSSDSIYSQASASTRRHTMLSMYEVPPPVPRIPFAFRATLGPRPLPQVPDDVLRRVHEGEQGDLNRMPTKVIAGLVKGRVQRTKGADLDRQASKVSRIERADSIKSVATPSDDDEEETTSMSLHYPRLERTRSRWEKGSQARMDTVMESPASASPDAYYAFNASPLRQRNPFTLTGTYRRRNMKDSSNCKLILVKASYAFEGGIQKKNAITTLSQTNYQSDTFSDLFSPLGKLTRSILTKKYQPSVTDNLVQWSPSLLLPSSQRVIWAGKTACLLDLSVESQLLHKPPSASCSLSRRIQRNLLWLCWSFLYDCEDFTTVICDAVLNLPWVSDVDPNAPFMVLTVNLAGTFGGRFSPFFWIFHQLHAQKALTEIPAGSPARTPPQSPLR